MYNILTAIRREMKYMRGNIAEDFFKRGFNCSQAVVLAYNDYIQMEGVQFAQLKFEWLYDILFFIKLQVFLTRIHFFVQPYKNAGNNGG